MVNARNCFAIALTAFVVVSSLSSVSAAEEPVRFSNVADIANIAGTCSALGNALTLSSARRTEDGDRLVLALWNTEAATRGWSALELRQVCVEVDAAYEELRTNMQTIDEAAIISEQLGAK